MVITVGTSLIAITAFYGTWTGLDFIFKSTDTRPYGLATNGAYCFVSLMYKMHGLIRTCTNSVLIHTFCLYPPFSTKCTIADYLTKAQWIFKSSDEISLQCPRGVKSLSHKT